MFGVDFAPFSSDGSPGSLALKDHQQPPLAPRFEAAASLPRSERMTVESFTTPQPLTNTTTTALGGTNTSGGMSVSLKLADYLKGTKGAGFYDTAMVMAIEDWMRITHQVMDYQYVNDINNYVKTVQDEERNRLTTQFHSINNDVMKTKIVYTHTQRDAMMLHSRIRVLLHSILFVSVFAFLYANRLFLGAFAYVLIAAVSVAFGIYILMHLKISASRSYDDYDRVRFNDEAINAATAATPEAKDAAGGQCQNPSLGALNNVIV